MLSQADRVGLQASIHRVDDSSFIEHEVQQTLNEHGTAVTECWLEVEEGAVFTIRISRSEPSIKHVTKAKGWKVKAFIDGSRLSGSYWPDPTKAMVYSHIYTGGSGDATPTKGVLTFTLPTGGKDSLSSNSPSPLSCIGEIRIDLTPGTCTLNDAFVRPHITRSAQEVYGDVKRWAVGVRASLDGETVAPKKTFDFEASKPTIWHSFIFKYGRRVDLQSIGAIQPDLAVPPPLATSLKGIPIEATNGQAKKRRVRRKVKKMTRVAGRTSGSEGDQPGFADMSVDAVEDVLGMDMGVC